MRANVGPADRMMRGVIGSVLLVAAFIPVLTLTGHPILQWSAAGVAAALIATALVRFCPLYTLIGLSTWKVSTND